MKFHILLKMNRQIGFLLLFLISASSVISQVTEYNQCAGIGYNGLTQCAPGLVCQKNSDWFSMCVKGQVTQQAANMANYTKITNAKSSGNSSEMGHL